MGGRENDPSRELDRWLEASHAEMEQPRREMNELERPSSSSISRQRQSSDNTSPPLSSSSSNESTPEWFKGLVDRSLTTLSESFRNFPSNISELKARMQQEFEARRAEERDIWRRWTGSDDSPDHIQMQIERSSKDERAAQGDAARILVREALQHNGHVPLKKIVDLYRDVETPFGALDEFAAPMLSFGGACYYKPETVENLPSTARWGWPASKQPWLSVEWFKRDPYSPIRLEAHPDLEQSGSKWRLAFEDLLSASLDKPMTASEKVGRREPYGRPQSTLCGPGLDWMLSLQCRGILPPQLPSIYRRFKSSDLSLPLSHHRAAFEKHVQSAFYAPRSVAFGSSTTEDFRALQDEIAIQSGPSTEAAPIEYRQTSWRVPETEEELYEETLPTMADLYGVKVPETREEWHEEFRRTSKELYEELREDMPSIMAALMTGFSSHPSDPRTPQDPEGAFGIDHDKENCGIVLFIAAMDNDVEKGKKALEDFYDRNGHIDLGKLGHAAFLKQVVREADIPQSVKEWLESPDESASSAAALTPSHKQQERLSSKQESLPAAVAKSEILSQLTTTETTRAADGTVTTKVVLKQRFADGREETRESVHTSREDDAPNSTVQVGKETEKPAKKGWFWS